MTSSALELHGRRFDDPLRRLPWTFAVAFALLTILLWCFGGLMRRPERFPEPKPVEVQLLGVPPPRPAVRAQPQPVKESKPALPPKRLIIPEQLIRPVTTESLSASAPAPQQREAPVASLPSSPTTASIPTSSNSAPRDNGNMGAQAIEKPMPKIPDELREQAFSAVALARFKVAVDGSATVELVTPTPNPRLNQLLLESLRNWRFFPAMKEGKPVATTQEIRIQFEVK